MRVATSRRRVWLWLLTGFVAARIAAHISGFDANAGKQPAGEGSLVAFFHRPAGTVVEVLGRDSALVVRLEVAPGHTLRVEQPVQPLNAPAYGEEVREFVGDVSIVIQADAGAPGPTGAAGRGQPAALSGPRVRMDVNDSIVRVLP